jgi:hypothetical protein
LPGQTGDAGGNSRKDRFALVTFNGTNFDQKLFSGSPSVTSSALLHAPPRFQIPVRLIAAEAAGHEERISSRTEHRNLRINVLVSWVKENLTMSMENMVNSYFHTITTDL